MAAIVTVLNEGDSLTAAGSVPTYVWQYAGYGVSDTPPPNDQTNQRLWQYKKTGSFVGINLAIPGSRITDLVTRSAALYAMIPANRLAPAASSAPPAGHESTPRAARKYILTVMVGTNQTGATGQLQADAVASYLDASHAAGVDKILLATIPVNGGTDKAAFNTYRNAYNTIIKGGAWMAAHFVDAIIDFAADPDIGGDDACDDTDFFNPDKVHLIEAGQAIAATIYGTTMAGVLATL